MTIPLLIDDPKLDHGALVIKSITSQTLADILPYTKFYILAGYEGDSMDR
jgi:hypothetical protein